MESVFIVQCTNYLYEQTELVYNLACFQELTSEVKVSYRDSILFLLFITKKADDVMMQVMINNRTDVSKTDVSLLKSLHI